MRQTNWDLPEKEQDIVLDIVIRAKSMDSKIDAISLSMDLTVTHKYICQLRLDDLFHSDDFNFKHDVYGIMNNLDRQNLVLKNNFLPRFCGGDKNKAK